MKVLGRVDGDALLAGAESAAKQTGNEQQMAENHRAAAAINRPLRQIFTMDIFCRGLAANHLSEENEMVSIWRLCGMPAHPVGLSRTLSGAEHGRRQFPHWGHLSVLPGRPLLRFFERSALIGYADHRDLIPGLPCGGKRKKLQGAFISLSSTICLRIARQRHASGAI